MILVTGASGFIGKEVIKALRCTFPSEVIVGLTHRKAPKALKERLPDTHVRFLQVDFSNPGTMRKVPRTFETLVHIGAYVPKNSEYSNSDKCFEVNCVGSRHLIELCKSNPKLKQVVLSSSMSVYGDQEGKLSEETACHPANAYGQSKWIAEHMFEVFCRSQKIPMTVFRFSSVYGPGQNPNTVLPLLIRRAQNHLPLQLFGRGKRYQDFIYVKDVANAHVLAIKKRKGGIYNIGSGLKTDMNKLAKSILLSFDSNSGQIQMNSKKETKASQFLNIRKATKELGFKPSYGLQKGLRDYAKELKANDG